MATETQKILQQDYPWIKQPLIVSAPMRPYATSPLATSVSLEGGIGTLSWIADRTDKDLEEASKALAPITASSTSSQPLLPLGIGYLIHSTPIAGAREQIAKYRPAIVWLFAPSPKDRNPEGTLESWASMAREASPESHVWVQVGSVADARHAVAACAPSNIVLIAQGLDAGGHGLARGAGIVTLVPEIRDMLARDPATANIPVLAAGGIMDGRGGAAALALGADGIILGTRILCATEAGAPPGFKEAILAAADGGQSTERTILFDKLRGTKLGGDKGWPVEYDGRGLRNVSSEEEAQGKGFDSLKLRFDEQVIAGRPERFGVQGRDVTYAGTGVGLVSEIKPAAEIVRETRSGMLEILSRLGQAVKL